MVKINELSAINTMLSIIGEAPINSLEGSLTADIQMAKNILDEVNLEVQLKGWNFNTEYDWPLSPEIGTGYIHLPASYLRVDADRYPHLDIIERDGRLYSKRKRSYVFNQTLKVDIIFLHNFDELPEVAKRYIMIRAARIFQRRAIGEEVSEGFSRDEEALAKINLEQAEADTADHNLLTGNYSTFRIINRRIG